MADEIGWWKCAHGAPFNGDFAPIAEMARTTRGEVANVDWALRDCASRAKDRGSIAGFNPGYVAALMQIKLAKVEAILAAMRTLRVIDNDRMPSFDSLQQIGSSTGRVRRWRAKQASERDATGAALHETHVTPETQSQSRESESEKIDRDDSARERARGSASVSVDGRATPGDDERSLEVDCRALVEGLPVSVDTNFVPILRLIDAGMTRADVLGGIREAVELRSVRARSWSLFERFIREKAKDRLERAGPTVFELRPRPHDQRDKPGGAGPPARESTVAATIRQLQEIRAEDMARVGAAP